MTPAETPDELWTQAQRMANALALELPAAVHADVARIIDALLARLTAAEAIVQRAETIIVGHGLEGDEHAYRTLQMIRECKQ